MRNLDYLGTLDFVTLADGTRLRYLKAGTGKPLLLMHTIRTQLDYFEAVIPALSRHFTVYAVDLPGHGYASIDRTGEYDEPYLRQRIMQFIEQLDLHELILAGESIGAVLALTVASRLPKRVRRVLAANPYDYDRRYGDGIRRGNAFANFIIGNLAIPVHGAIFAALENSFVLGRIMAGGLKRLPAVPAPLLEEFNTAGKRPGYRYVERQVLAGWRSWPQARQWYPTVRVPVTLVYGAGDWSTAEERLETQRRLSLDAVVTLPETGHFAFIDNPEPLQALLLEMAT